MEKKENLQVVMYVKEISGGKWYRVGRCSKIDLFLYLDPSDAFFKFQGSYLKYSTIIIKLPFIVIFCRNFIYM